MRHSNGPLVGRWPSGFEQRTPTLRAKVSFTAMEKLSRIEARLLLLHVHAALMNSTLPNARFQARLEAGAQRTL
jgi:hypothetical protein